MLIQLLKMFVVVYLIDAKVHTVIPKEFVHELSRESLFNKGVNPNQKRLIYFSQKLFDELQFGIENDNEYHANFSLPITKDYPLPNGLSETCFEARLKKFFRK